MIMRQVRMVENKGRANEPRIVSVIIFALLMTAGLMAPLASLSAGEVFMGTVAGTGTSGFSGDAGFAMGGKLAAPEGVAVDAQHNVYIADTGNHRIRKLTAATGMITTIAGTGTGSSTGDGGQAAAATLFSPASLALTSSGLLYISERGGHRIRCITLSTGVITTVAGSGVAGYIGDGASATAARLNAPNGIFVNATGELFIADTTNHRIRKVSAGIITTVAGTGTAGLSGDGGPATSAQLSSPYGVAITATGNLLIADTGNSRIRQMSGTTMTTIAGTTSGFSGDGGTATAAKMTAPRRLLVLSNGDILISDFGNHRVRKIAGSIISTVYGTGTAGYSGDGALASAAKISAPQEMALDSLGAIFIADTNNRRVRVTSMGPVIKTRPAVTTNPLFSTYSAVTTLGADTNGEASVIYTWSTVETVPDPVTWGDNATNVAKATNVNFTRAGTYHLAVTISDGTNLPLTTGITLVVMQSPGSVAITPAATVVPVAGTQTFKLTTTGTDQFGKPITELFPTWSVVAGGGTISSIGDYTAPSIVGGPHTITATYGSFTATAQVNVMSPALVNGTPLVQAPAFDHNLWDTDVNYRTAYLAEVNPGRVWQTATPGVAVPVLKPDGPRLLSSSSFLPTKLQVIGAPSAPVTFTVFSDGGLGPTLLNSQTVVADAAGLASTTFSLLRGGTGMVRAASPKASQFVQFTINTIPAP